MKTVKDILEEQISYLESVNEGLEDDIIYARKQLADIEEQYKQNDALIVDLCETIKKLEIK